MNSSALHFLPTIILAYKTLRETVSSVGTTIFTPRFLSPDQQRSQRGYFFYAVQIKLTMIRNQGEGIAGVIQKTYLEAITKHRINRQPISQGRKIQVKIFLPPLLDPSHD